MNRSAVRYNHPMKDMLALYKYRGDERLAHLMGKMLVHAYAKLREDCGAERQAYFDCITYVPVSEERMLDRGFNQAEQMAHELAKWVQLPVIPLLCRTRSTSKQSFKTREERIKDMKGAFAPDESGFHLLSRLPHQAGDLQHPQRIILIDDVYTTGSTMNQCAAVLASGRHTEVFGLTWAR
ncbi:ComF family protein [Gorillibacterium massiliense]|uniref:ComF family protein n=1 Tax=Gorillibacterium massiliense TaxID=1280390 RepID=UPI0012DCAACF|nr:ComF family protein [Gorillibacterium massiliense]